MASVSSMPQKPINRVTVSQRLTVSHRLMGYIAARPGLVPFISLVSFVEVLVTFIT